MKPRPTPEKAVQSQVVHLLRSVGGRVWVTGTRRPRGEFQGTCMTAGLPDVVAFVRARMLMIEVKAKGGRLRPEQIAFRDECVAASVDHIVGGVDEVCAWLIDKGVLRAENVAHYRTPDMTKGHQ